MESTDPNMESTGSIAPMDHDEAIQRMAAERYLLNELEPALREAFEAHFFDCPECAFDVRAGSAFVEEAKRQLPPLSPATGQTASARPFRAAKRETDPSTARKFPWQFWWQPAFAAPVFATLLLLIGYQNLITLPALRTEATQPRILPWVPLHAATRGAERTTVLADRKSGVVLSLDLPQQTSYASYLFELTNGQGHPVWSQAFTAPMETGGRNRAGERSWDGTVPLLIPGRGLAPGVYTLSVFGLAPGAQRIALQSQVFDLEFTE